MIHLKYFIKKNEIFLRIYDKTSTSKVGIGLSSLDWSKSCISDICKLTLLIISIR